MTIADRRAVLERLGSDPASQHLGISVLSIRDDAVEVALDAQPWMLNGHGILHGAVLFWLGDTAFAFLSESKGVPSVSRQADITYIAPVPAGASLRATATQKIRFGRNAIIDIDVLQGDGDGELRLVARMTVHGAAVRTA